jgi:ketosteroid isomerase-like protein
MLTDDYAVFRALDPFFAVVMEGLSKFVDGKHYFDTLDDDVLFEFRYDFPGWPQVTRGRANLVALYSGYGNNIRLDRGDSLITHPSENGRVVTLEYEVHGKILATDTPYDNRFVSIATIENRKIVRWRDYMDAATASVKSTWSVTSSHGRCIFAFHKQHRNECHD